MGAPSDVERLKRPDLLALIWEVLECYSDVFPSLPKGVPPARMGHEFKIDLEDETRPIHTPLCKLSTLELEEVKKQIQDMLENGIIRPSESPYGTPVLFVPKKDAAFSFVLITVG